MLARRFLPLLFLLVALPKEPRAEQPPAPRGLRFLPSAEDIPRPAVPTEEFHGPFRNWLDAKRDFGARGDGVTDDTSALQAGLDAVRSSTSAPVLFIPKGTYRITRPLELVRSGHVDSKDVMVLGEDPVDTILRWDGVAMAHGSMLRFGAWWARLGRLTLDGADRIKTGISHGKLFSSINELSDLTFQNLGIGIEAGELNGAAVAETTVLRCRFLRCRQAGISLQNWNSLDWYVWDSVFEDCGYGIANVFGAGHFQVYRSFFQRSTEADIAIGNTSYFSIRHCTSVDSQAFFVARPTGAPALITLQGNTIYRTGKHPVTLGNLGPLLLLHNRFHQNNRPAVLATHPRATGFALGNTFTASSSSPLPPLWRAIDSRDERVAEIFPPAPPAHLTPPRSTAPVLELDPGATHVQIQTAIAAAVRSDSSRTVIHLPAGLYRISESLVIPPNADICLVGDGGKTVLQWARKEPGDLLHVQGPTRVLLRDLRFHGGGIGRGLLVEGCDAVDAHVLLEQLDVRHQSSIGLELDGLRHASIHARSLYHSKSKLGVHVAGPLDGSAENVGNAKLAIFGGASSDNILCYDVTRSGTLLVQDTWYESRSIKANTFARLTDSGRFTLHGAAIAPLQASETIPTLLLDGFRGQCTLVSTLFQFAQNRLAVRAPAASTRLLVAGSVAFVPPELPTTAMAAGEIANIRSTGGGGGVPRADRGNPESAFLKEMLELTVREVPRPLPVLSTLATDIRLHRVCIESGSTGMTLRP